MCLCHIFLRSASEKPMRVQEYRAIELDSSIVVLDHASCKN